MVIELFSQTFLSLSHQHVDKRRAVRAGGGVLALPTLFKTRYEKGLHPIQQEFNPISLSQRIEVQPLDKTIIIMLLAMFNCFEEN